MTDETQPPIGSICWTDLTVENADELRDFYAKVANWTHAPVAMGDYNDYCMNAPETGKTVAGICHARGPNANIPPQWMIYITVENVKQAADRCAELGGEVIDGPRKVGEQQFCIIRDPAGAVAGLIGG